MQLIQPYVQKSSSTSFAAQFGQAQGPVGADPVEPFGELRRVDGEGV